LFLLWSTFCVSIWLSPSLSHPYHLTLPALMALPGVYTATGIALRVIGVCKPPHHIKVLVHEEGTAL
jgi:hypothetical protein